MTTVPERALSIRQPWASLILGGHKPVENRTWRTSWTGQLLVHAGRSSDMAGHIAMRGQAIDPETCPWLIYTGGYLGTAVLTGVHLASDGCCQPWGEADTYHWTLSNPPPLQTPIAGPGRLGLYRPHDDVLQSLAAQRTRP